MNITTYLDIVLPLFWKQSWVDLLLAEWPKMYMKLESYSSSRNFEDRSMFFLAIWMHTSLRVGFCIHVISKNIQSLPQSSSILYNQNISRFCTDSWLNGVDGRHLEAPWLEIGIQFGIHNLSRLQIGVKWRRMLSFLKCLLHPMMSSWCWFLLFPKLGQCRELELTSCMRFSKHTCHNDVMNIKSLLAKHQLISQVMWKYQLYAIWIWHEVYHIT